MRSGLYFITCLYPYILGRGKRRREQPGAQLQNADAFWSMHDQIFQHQQEITADNVKQKLSEYAQNTKSLDAKSFQSCLDNEMSLGLVFRDMNLASANNVDSTPTLFVNGHHVPGIKDVQQLRDVIVEAKKEATQAGVSNIARARP